MDFRHGTRSEEDFLNELVKTVERVVDVRKGYEACFPWLKSSMVNKIYPPTNEALITAFKRNMSNLAHDEGIAVKFQTLRDLEQQSNKDAKWRPPRDVNVHLRPARIQAKRKYLTVLKNVIDVKTDSHKESLALIEKTMKEIRDKTKLLTSVCDACEPRLDQLARIEEIGCKLIDSCPIVSELDVK